MCIRDSLDIVKRIISLTVNFPRARGVLQVKYEADNYQDVYKRQGKRTPACDGSWNGLGRPADEEGPGKSRHPGE